MNTPTAACTFLSPAYINHEDLRCKCRGLCCLRSIPAACRRFPVPARAGGSWSIPCCGILITAVNMRLLLGSEIMLQVVPEDSSRKRPTGGLDIRAVRCAAIRYWGPCRRRIRSFVFGLDPNNSLSVCLSWCWGWERWNARQ